MTTDPLATLLESIPYGGGMTTTVLAARLAAAGVTLTQPNTAHQPCLDCKSGGSAHWHDGTEHRSQPQPDAGLREALEKFVTGEGAMATDPDGDCYFCEAEGVDFELPFHPGADPDHAGEHEDWCLVPIARAALRSTPAAPHQHRFDVVIRDDEHMRLLGCSNTPCEEAYQWDR